jgi:hypothetical protein
MADLYLAILAQAGDGQPARFDYMAHVVYSLCVLLSVSCAAMLLRSWWRSPSRLLLWCGLCFVALAANNLLLLVQLFVEEPEYLELSRNICIVAGLAVLIFGLVWDSN